MAQAETDWSISLRTESPPSVATVAELAKNLPQLHTLLTSNLGDLEPNIASNTASTTASSNMATGDAISQLPSMITVGNFSCPQQHQAFEGTSPLAITSESAHSTHEAERKMAPHNAINTNAAMKSSMNAAVKSSPLKKRLVLKPGSEPLIAPMVVSPVDHHAGPNKQLLSQPGDAAALPPVHALVRQHIELFTATHCDITAKCPGRKHPIQLHQVGLRCLHCQDLPNKDRVKRAVCYPTSTSRIYNAVSDMKFDHFSSCPSLPLEVRQQLQTLKNRNDGKRTPRKRDALALAAPSSSTAKYYHDAAVDMGMMDGAKGGVFLGHSLPSSASPSHRKTGTSLPPAPCAIPRQPVLCHNDTPTLPDTLIVPKNNKAPVSRRVSEASCMDFDERPRKKAKKEAARSTTTKSPPSVLATNSPKLTARKHGAAPSPLGSGGDDAVVLAMPGDTNVLNDLHCFVRRHIEVFAATPDDVAAPCPGRRVPIQNAQVGLRCVHCKKLSYRQRVKRAVCYPLTIGQIYHCVSNMKFDHFGNCRGLAPPDREEFNALRARCVTRKNSGGKTSDSDVSTASEEAKGRSSSSSSAAPGEPYQSTAQYYHDSALRLGLIDTPRGIRFGDKNSVLEESSSQIINTASSPQAPTTAALFTSFDKSGAPIPDGISALMIAATDPNARAMYGFHHHHNRRYSSDDESLNHDEYTNAVMQRKGWVVV